MPDTALMQFLFCIESVGVGRILSAHTNLQQLPYIKNGRATMFFTLANCLPDHDFPFYIFNFMPEPYTVTVQYRY